MDAKTNEMCGIDGCHPGSPGEVAGPRATDTILLELEVFSDVICPWCYVGKRRLEHAITSIAPQITVSVSWRAYELNPGMPPQGKDRREYRSAKFGSWEASQRLDAQVARVGRIEGLNFHHDLMRRTPNTRHAHRLMWRAAQEGRQDAVVEGLFRAYFSEGRDVGQPDQLATIAAAAGFNREEVLTWLGGEEGLQEVIAEESRALHLQLLGVPSVVFQERLIYSGAQPPEEISRLLRAVAASTNGGTA